MIDLIFPYGLNKIVCFDVFIVIMYYFDKYSPLDTHQ